MDFLNGRLQAYLGPPGNAGAPDDLEKVIVDFIDQSEHTLDIAVQEIDNPRIAKAIDSVAGENIQGVSKLQRYLFEGASPRFEAFLRGAVGRTLDLF